MFTRILLVIAALLHAAFAFGEMFPWDNPKLLQSVAGEAATFTDAQRNIIATIVHNAGIYNAALAAGLAGAAMNYRPNGRNELVLPLFIGVTIVGVFGAATLPSIPTAIQAA